MQVALLVQFVGLMAVLLVLQTSFIDLQVASAVQLEPVVELTVRSLLSGQVQG